MKFYNTDVSMGITQHYWRSLVATPAILRKHKYLSRFRLSNVSSRSISINTPYFTIVFIFFSRLNKTSRQYSSCSHRNIDHGSVGGGDGLRDEPSESDSRAKGR